MCDLEFAYLYFLFISNILMIQSPIFFFFLIRVQIIFVLVLFMSKKKKKNKNKTKPNKTKNKQTNKQESDQAWNNDKDGRVDFHDRYMYSYDRLWTALNLSRGELVQMLYIIDSDKRW